MHVRLTSILIMVLIVVTTQMNTDVIIALSPSYSAEAHERVPDDTLPNRYRGVEDQKSPRASVAASMEQQRTALSTKLRMKLPGRDAGLTCATVVLCFCSRSTLIL